MYFVITALVNPGDEVIYPNPGFPIYESVINFVGGVGVPIPLREESGFGFDLDLLERKASAKTKLIVINSPQNPTGGVLEVDQLGRIAEIARRYRIPVLTDEIYKSFLYDGEFASITRFPGLEDLLIILDGFSKAYAMTGWRLGYVIVPKPFVRTLQTLHQNFFISSNEFVQWAGVAALREAGPDVVRFRAAFDARRRAMVDGLRAIGLRVGPEPTGAFYVLADARAWCERSYDFAFELLAGAHVAVTPGIDFGPGGEGHLRFSYASSLARIGEGLRRVGDFLRDRDPRRGGREGDGS
jgi:aspartate/methionine/tyrosine aminotransferase